MSFLPCNFKNEVLKAKENDPISNEEELPEFHPHPHYPALSDVIKIEYTKQRGRYGVAARDIQVFIQKMYLIFLLNNSATLRVS